MNYDEKVFKEKANKKARRIWLVFAILLTANYGSDFSNGLYPANQYLIFVLLCWIPFFSGDLLLRIKGKDSDLYRWDLIIGYGIFYTFVLCTTASPIAFTYILPVTSLLVLYKNRKFMICCGIANSISVIISAVYRGAILGFTSADDMKNYQLQMSCIILCYICYVMSIRHLNESDGALTDSIKADLHRVVTTVAKVKTASNTIMDGITVVRELASENKHGADVVMLGMNDLTDNNDHLEEQSTSSKDMTAKINAQVEQVASMIEQMVTLTTESGRHAETSASDLESLVQTTNTMSELSSKVEHILDDFRSEFATVMSETSKIDDISGQTNLLALNASIEAARAGEAGKGFSVVAEQIRTLSTETKASSGQIQAALARLDEISSLMTSSIEETIRLIQLTLEKVTLTGSNVGEINTDVAELGEHIQAIDNAMREVEESNQKLVDNMDDVADTVTTISESIRHSSEISKKMLSKYAESGRNIDNIENTIQGLMCELGIGGFMGISDVNAGMKITVRTGEGNSTKDYHGELTGQSDSSLSVLLTDRPSFGGDGSCQIYVTVGNIIYFWEKAAIQDGGSGGSYTVSLYCAPKILNRRKYPRMDIENDCTVTLTSTGKTYRGKMDNISANGFAMLMTEPVFAESKGADVTVSIHNFALSSHSVFEGHIIRCSDNDGMYIVGCQMPEDDFTVKQYVESCLNKGERTFS